MSDRGTVKRNRIGSRSSKSDLVKNGLPNGPLEKFYDALSQARKCKCISSLYGIRQLKKP